MAPMDIFSNLIANLLALLILAILGLIWARSTIVKRYVRLLIAALRREGPVDIFEAQIHADCKEELIDQFDSASSEIRILTIRGLRYFSRKAGLFFPLLRQKAIDNVPIKVLVCSPESTHIDLELVRGLRKSSVEEIRRNMRLALDNLEILMNEYKNLDIRVYEEVPIWNILQFDDTMYVSAYVEPKSHQNAVVHKIPQSSKSHFAAFDKHFNSLWQGSVPLQEFISATKE